MTDYIEQMMDDSENQVLYPDFDAVKELIENDKDVANWTRRRLRRYWKDEKVCKM